MFFLFPNSERRPPLRGRQRSLQLALCYCAQRYHRVIFLWFLGTIGFHNLSVLFKYLYIAYIGDFKAFYHVHEASGLGYLTWLQLTLATALIEHGVKRACDELPEGHTRPHFMPGICASQVARPSLPRRPSRRRTSGATAMTLPLSGQETGTSCRRCPLATAANQCYRAHVPATP